MTAKELVALGRLLAGYLVLFVGRFSSRPIFEHFGAYCRGRLSDLPRNSVDPIALQCGTLVRTLQRFLRTSFWVHGRMRDLYQQRLATLPQPGPTLPSLAGIPPPHDRLQQTVITITSHQQRNLAATNARKMTMNQIELTL